MIRLFSVIFMGAALLSFAVRAEGPDDAYVDAYNLISEADNLAAGGQGDRANERYREAEAALKSIQSSYPTYNPATIEFRLKYIEQQLNRKPGPAAAPADNTRAATRQPKTAAPAVQPRVVTPARPVGPSMAELAAKDQQITNLTEVIRRMEGERNVLNAKLQEALAAQPAVADPRELTKAEERIRALEKEKELLRVSLDQERSKPAVDPAKDQAAQKTTAELRDQIAQRDAKLANLALERDALQNEVKNLRQGASAPKPDTVATARVAELQQQVASLQQTVSSLQAEKSAWEKERAASKQTAVAPKTEDRAKEWQSEREDLQKKVNEANRQIAMLQSKSSSAGGSEQLTKELNNLRARLEVYDQRKAPFTQEELALFDRDNSVKPKELATAKPAKKNKEIPSGAGILVADAQRAFAAHRFPEAEEKYQRVLKMDEKSVFTLGNLAAVQIEENKLADAEQNLNKALAIDPNDAYSLALLGVIRFDQQKYDDALDLLSRAAQTDPNNPQTQNYLGMVLSEKGQRGPAEAALRKAVALAPQYAAAHNNLAVVYATQQPPATELARYHYKKALDAGHPKNEKLEEILAKASSK